MTNGVKWEVGTDTGVFITGSSRKFVNIEVTRRFSRALFLILPYQVVTEVGEIRRLTIKDTHILVLYKENTDIDLYRAGYVYVGTNYDRLGATIKLAMTIIKSRQLRESLMKGWSS